MKLKNKGKVYPSPPCSSSSSGEDYLPILKLLPAAILALALALSLEDREVLAYMIARSLKTTTTTTTIKKRSSKKPPPIASKLTQKSGVSSHKPPVFDCDCFDCYTSYWLRWDSSPNLELIHQIIEAFEDYLTKGESQLKPSKKKARPKRRDGKGKTAVHVSDSPVVDLPGQPDHEASVSDSSAVDGVISTGKDVEEDVAEVAEVTEEFSITKNADMEAPTGATTTTSNHKGSSRKVLRDVLGLFISRLWGLWNPNVQYFSGNCSRP